MVSAISSCFRAIRQVAISLMAGQALQTFIQDENEDLEARVQMNQLHPGGISLEEQGLKQLETIEKVMGNHAKQGEDHAKTTRSPLNSPPKSPRQV